MGFFSTGELVKKARQDIDLDSLQPQCQKCGAYKDARTKKLGPTGMGEKKILIVGDFPSEQDDFHCTQFHGEIGEFINERARAAGLSINRDCWRVNAIRCIIYDVQIEPGKEAERLRRYMNFCRASLEKTIHELKPDYVLLLGDLAVNAAFGTTFGSAYNIERWRGVFIKDEVFKCTFFATYHPRSFVKYNNKDLGLKALIQRDLNQFFFAARDRKELYKQLPDYTQHISILTDFKHTCHVLDRIIAEKHSIYFDYETTGLKPFRNGHKIACIGMALSEKNAYVIPFQYKYTWNNRELESIRLRWFQILSDPKIHKSAHNCFSGDTKFITKAGLISFKDSCDTEQYVWNTNGWCRARIRNYGTAALTRLTLVPFNRSRSNIEHQIDVTANHRWIVHRKVSHRGKYSWVKLDNVATKDLREKDRILAKLPVHVIDIHSDAFRHGLIFADGSRTSRSIERGNYAYQMRLCGHKEVYKDCFPVYTYPISAMGDPVINHYASTVDLKEVPVEGTSEYIANFIAGWQAFDGTDSTAGCSRVVTTTRKDAALWLMENASTAGWFCTGASEHIMSSRNSFGKIGTVYYMIVLTKMDDMSWTIDNIHPEHHVDTVYCAEVDGLDEFTLQYGIYTKNSKFEDMWSAVIIGSRIKSVEWCTQMGTHIIDNRSVFSGLKFQTFMQFGIRPYDDHIHPYLESVEGSEFNRVFEAPTKDLMIYCGLDCIYGLKLKHLQQSLFSREDHKGRFHAFKFFKKGLGVMSEMQLNGVKLNEQHYFYCLSDVSKRGQELYKKLTTESKEARAFKNTYSREINIDSSEDLGKLYFEVLQHEGEKTAAGRWKTDKNALARIKSPFTRDLAAYKKLTKMGNTYLNNMLTEYVEGRIHPFFDLHIPVTYRSSSSKPNFQNLPKRDPEAMKQIRSGIVPDEDCVIMEIDFSGAEVNVSCAYHRDKNFYKYLTDPTTDMHRDCYDMQTQILTENGFKYFNDITTGERIAQYIPEANIVEYIFPSKRIQYDHNGDMYYIRNNYVDVLVTPNHRLYLKHIGKDYNIVKANEVTKASYYSKTSTDIVDIVQPQNFHFDAVYGIGHNSTKKYHSAFQINVDDMFELLGYLITDGHFKYHKQQAYRINLSQIKPKSRAKMKKCIDRIKSYSYFLFHEEKDKWSMSNKNFCTWLCDNFGVNKINRKLPKFVTHAPIKQLQLFFDACVCGDGTIQNGKNSGCFYTTSMQLLDDFQFICMRLGYSTRITKQRLKGNRTVQLYIIHILFKSEYHVNAKDSKNFGKEAYNGKVFCFTVPSGLLVTRRNNKISIQGNSACDILKLSHDELAHPDFTKEQKKLAKKIRNETKNKWVFAEFYGDWYESCGKALYEVYYKNTMYLPNGLTTAQHMDNCGIGDLEDFLMHCKDMERVMWEERFPEYTQWKKDIYDFYIKHGYIDTYLGFRFQGYMNRKHCSNYPIQSTSFHLLVYTIIQASKFIRKHKLKTKLVMQIHDSLVASVPIKEINIYAPAINSIITNLHKTFKWMNVPMQAEAEITRPFEDGGNLSSSYVVPAHMLDTGKIVLSEVYGK